MFLVFFFATCRILHRFIERLPSRPACANRFVFVSSFLQFVFPFTSHRNARRSLQARHATTATRARRNRPAKDSGTVVLLLDEASFGLVTSSSCCLLSVAALCTVCASARATLARAKSTRTATIKTRTLSELHNRSALLCEPPNSSLCCCCCCQMLGRYLHHIVAACNGSQGNRSNRQTVHAN